MKPNLARTFGNTMRLISAGTTVASSRLSRSVWAESESAESFGMAAALWMTE